MTHFQSMMCFFISPEAGLFVYFQQKLNWFYELIQPKKQKKHVTSSMDRGGQSCPLCLWSCVWMSQFCCCRFIFLLKSQKIVFSPLSCYSELTSTLGQFYKQNNRTIYDNFKNKTTQKNLLYHNLGDQISEKTWGAITKEQPKTTLTFVVQEEGKEANKHDRLEVVHGVDRVLKPCRNVQHETMKEERKRGARLDFQICKILLQYCLILLFVMLNPQISQRWF